MLFHIARQFVLLVLLGQPIEVGLVEQACSTHGTEKNEVNA